MWGMTRDTYGSRYTSTASIVMCATGAIAMAFAQSTLALAVAMFCMGCGSGVQLTLQPVARLFRTQGWVISTFAGGFQISVLMFLFILSISEDRRVAFAGYAAFLLILAVIVFLFVPNSFEREDGTEAAISVTEEKKESSDTLESGAKTSTEDNSSENVESSVADTLWAQLCNIEYILLVVWLSVLLVPMQYYIGTIGYQLEQRGDDDGTYSRAFSAVYAASAIAGPPLGYFVDRFGVSTGQTLASTFLAVSFFILANRRFSLPVHVLGMACYGIGRMAAYAMYFTNIGKRFGFTNFGTLSGLGLLISAVISLVQYPLIAVATTKGTGMFDMANDTITDIACGCVMLLPLPYYGWLFIHERR